MENNDEINIVKNIFKNIENVRIFVIEKNNKNSIVLKLHISSENMNLLTEGEIHSLFVRGDIKTTKNLLNKSIVYLENPKPFYYRMLGFIYLNIEDYKNAYMYLKIAEGMSKYTKNRYRFDSLIKKIERKKNTL